MSKKKTNVPVQTRSSGRQFSPMIAGDVLAPFSRLRDEIDRMFDLFTGALDAVADQLIA